MLAKAIFGRSAVIGAALLCGTLTAGGVWSGFRSPTATSWRQPPTSAPCPAIGVQNLDADQTRLILSAAAQVCDVLASPAFAQTVRAKNDWIMDCTAEGMAGKPINADAVLNALTPPSRTFSAVARKPWRAVAVTNLHFQGIAIRKQRFEFWASADAAKRAEMIETLSHEMTHLVPETPGSTASLFKDEDHVADPSRPGQCADARLVSYGTGKIVARIWREQLR